VGGVDAGELVKRASETIQRGLLPHSGGVVLCKVDTTLLTPGRKYCERAIGGTSIVWDEISGS
jgi:hypothetical protein